MFQVTRFNGSRMYINAEMVQFVESTPDTIITLTNNVKVLVKEPAETIIQRIIEYQRLVRNAPISSGHEGS